ncbi:MAG: sulfurtransferase TusA family protein [Bacillota bacterium]|jgi:tRNA 2-thiouridine synthesizing protein A
MKEIDARGLSCPEPVMLTKAALDAGESELIVMVDNGAAKDNVSRQAKSHGKTAEVEHNADGDFIIHIK